MEVKPPSAVARHIITQFAFAGCLPLRTAVALVAGMCFMRFTAYRNACRARNAELGKNAAPEYLSVLNAGTVLAGIIHKEVFDIIAGERLDPERDLRDGAGEVAVCTSNAAKDFLLSTEMLRLLLSSTGMSVLVPDDTHSGTTVGAGPCLGHYNNYNYNYSYTPHRRGRWYDRICINIERYLAADSRVHGTGSSSSAGAVSGGCREEVAPDVALSYLTLQYLLNSVHNDPYVEVSREFENVGEECLYVHIHHLPCVCACACLSVFRPTAGGPTALGEETREADQEAWHHGIGAGGSGGGGG